MFGRIEVAVRPEFEDPAAKQFRRRLELARPDLAPKVRWIRVLDVYWLDLPFHREEVIPAITEIFWDRVLQWLFSGNLIPAAAGKSGGIHDLLEYAPNRPGRFWGLERRLRPGVTDNVGRTALEAFEIVLGKKIEGGRAASGTLVVLEGEELKEEDLAVIAREILCNELIETWTLLDEVELQSSDRFHQERVKLESPRPKASLAAAGGVKTAAIEWLPIAKLSDAELATLSKKRTWALNLAEMKAIQGYYGNASEQSRREALGLKGPTDVELEVFAQTWSEHCKHKIFGAQVSYESSAGPADPAAQEIPATVNGLFRTTIVDTTSQLPKSWLLSVFDDNAGIVALDDETAFCIKVETHNSPSALDPYGGALTGIVGVNRDILGCGFGAKPVFNTDVFCVALPDHSKPLPERIMHPRRILDGIRRGVEHGGNKSGIPTINGALLFDERYLGKPLVYCGTGGIMPRQIAGRRCEIKEILVGDRVCMVGGRIGKDGIHGATFSSMAFDRESPSSAVQLGDPITQKRMIDFVLEARDLGLYRTLTDNGAGGLSSSVGELARLSGGARIDVSLAKTKYPGLKPYELVVSESQERMTIAVPPEKLELFLALAERRGVEVSDLGEFTDSGSFDVYYGQHCVASLELEFLHKGCPQLQLPAQWKGQGALPMVQTGSLRELGVDYLLGLLSRPNIASKEWLIRQYDHEVQGAAVVRPLHTAQAGTPQAFSGPNDAGVIAPILSHATVATGVGIAVGCGINPKYSDIDPYLMAQAAVDEAVRNVLCVGAEFGRPESVLALVDNFCWPDPVGDPGKMAALVRSCYGLRKAALALGAPLVSGKDSMKNDYHGYIGDQKTTISVPPTLLMTAVARVPDIKLARTADFKSPGDIIYLLGGHDFGLVGSELHSWLGIVPNQARVPQPNWEMAFRLYSWLGGADGRQQSRLRSAHDVSEGGLLVATVESMLARGYGARIDLPLLKAAHGENLDPWEMAFGEGFHGFVVSCAENDAQELESEWIGLSIPYSRIGVVTGQGMLEVSVHSTAAWAVEVGALRQAWKREGYWE